MSDWNRINSTDLDKHITGNWGEDSVRPDDDIVGMGLDAIQDMQDKLIQLRQIEQAARRLLNAVLPVEWRLTAATYGPRAHEVKVAIAELRAILDVELESSNKQSDEQPTR